MGATGAPKITALEYVMPYMQMSEWEQGEGVTAAVILSVGPGVYWHSGQPARDSRNKKKIHRWLNIMVMKPL